MSLELADKNGKIDDCVLGFDKMEEYDRHRSETACFGSTIGRVANRTGGAKFTVDGQETKLFVNCGDTHHLHGGETGWHRRMWKANLIQNGVEFTYTSPDGDDKYPGEVQASVRYYLTPDS